MFLLIVGASARAAAFSAIRAGHQPICDDRYSDADLRRHAVVVGADVQFQTLDDVQRKLGRVPWMYTGGLENDPARVASLMERFDLLGNGPAVLTVCRAPAELQEILKAGGFPSLPIMVGTSAPRDGIWLCKPVNSAGGRAIFPWTDVSLPPDEPHYFQPRVNGSPISAAYLAGRTAEGDSWCELLGGSAQLSGDAKLNAPAYAYCGSLVPSRIASLANVCRQLRADEIELAQTDLEFASRLQDYGRLLARQCGLLGLFGIDFMLTDKDLRCLEVNPRYTASMELIEQLLQRSLLRWHLAACQPKSVGTDAIAVRNEIREVVAKAALTDAYYGKVIQYADHAATAPNLSDLISQEITLTSWPTIADIPVAGSPIETGQPVFSCLGQGVNAKVLLNDLIRRSRTLWSQFAE